MRTSIRSCRSVGYNRFYDTALYSFAVSMSYNRFCNTEQLCSVNEFYNENEFYNTVHLCNAVSMSYNTEVHVHVHRSVSRDSGGGLGGCPVYRVVMLGGGGVGKSAICSQFLSSDHVNTYESVGNTSSEICRDFTMFPTVDSQRTRLRRMSACQWTEERVTWCSLIINTGR